jgi:hypothetical protein
MKTTSLLTLVLAAALGAILPSQAALLVYEGFNYTTGTAIPGGTGVQLNGQGTAGEPGLTGTWTAQNSNGANIPNSTTVYPQGSTTGITTNTTGTPANTFDGTVANLTTSGGFFGVSNATNVTTWTNGTDHIEVWRPLAASVTATFATGNTTWFSFVSTRGYSNATRSPSFYIGAGNLIEDRGNNATAPGIGGGGSNSGGAALIFPTYWNNSLISNSGTSIPSGGTLPWQGNTADPNGFGAPNITVGKIEWNADPNGGGDVISLFNFKKTDVISEAAFDAGITATPLLSSKNWPAFSPNLDETTFTMISIGGGRFFADEIRIGTTFKDVTPDPSFVTTAYDTWATTEPNNLSGGDAAFDFDYDNDGLDNGLEWILGGDPKQNDTPSVLPTVTGDAGSGLTLVFNRNPDSITETTLVVEWGGNLNPFANTLVIGTDDVGPSGDAPTVDIDAPAAGQVTVTLPAANAVGGKLFARLKATMP